MLKSFILAIIYQHNSLLRLVMKVLHVFFLLLLFSILVVNRADGTKIDSTAASGTVASSMAGAKNDDIKNYVDDLVDKSYKIINDKSLSINEKVARSSLLVKNNLHLDWMAKYVLGRNKRSISAEKIKEFTDIYSKFVVGAYAELVRDYSGEKANIKTIKRVDDYMYIVGMEMIKADSPDLIKVEYLVHKIDVAKNGSYKVADIITEGVSILNSQQAEFDSIISTQGIDGLIADLKNKVDLKRKEK